MRKIIPALIIFCLAIGFSSCKKTSAPAACVGSIPAVASAGVPVTFTSCTTGASAYLWSFGDSDTANGLTVSHTYAAAGTYTGTLTVTSSSGSSAKNFSITIVNNSWTFEGQTYITDSVTAHFNLGSSIVAAYGAGGGGYIVLDMVFDSLPTTSRSYAITPAATGSVGPGQVYVSLYILNGSGQQTAIFGSTGGGSTNAQVTVNGGRISVSLPTIEVVNQSVPSDSVPLSATGITQIQLN